MNTRQKLTLSLAIWLNVAIFAAAFALPAQGQPLGSIFITRNLAEHENTTPFSYWNHLAVVVDGGYVVESQEDRGGVILTRISDFLARPYKVGIYYPPTIEFGKRRAAIARTFVGRPYRRASSLAPLVVPPIIPTLLHGTPDGMNCVSVARDSSQPLVRRPLIGLREPDDLGHFHEIVSNRPPLQ
jgi:hypothetical protein